jgi:hypothetical protein
MGGEVADFAAELQQEDVDRIQRAVFPATEAGLTDPLSAKEFYASGGGQKEMEFDDCIISAKIEKELHRWRKNCEEYCREARRHPDPVQRRRPANNNTKMKRQPIQMEATCHCGHMFLPACGLSHCAESEETIRTRRDTHPDRAEEEITTIRKENHNSFVIAPF